MKNYYDLLEISIDSSKAEIKDAYRKLAHKYHPDKNANNADAQIFQSINEAKQVLFNEEKKAEYDVMLSDYLLATHVQKLRPANPFTISYTAKRSMTKNVFLIGLLAIVVAGAIIFITQMDSPDRDSKDLATKVEQSSKEPKLPSSTLPAAALANSAPAVKIEKNSEVKSVAVTKPTQLSTPENVVEQVPSAMPAPTVERTIATTKAATIFSDRQMEQILLDINSEKQRYNNANNCITVVKTFNSNVENAFDLAKYLSANGYTIAGRQTSNNSSENVTVNASDGCIQVVVGTL